MKRTILAVMTAVILTMTAITAISEPNGPATKLSVEQRLDAIEARLDALEQKAAGKTAVAATVGTAAADKDREAARQEKDKRQAQEARESADLIKSKIENVSPASTTTAERLEIIKTRYRLYSELENSLSKIKTIAERSPALGIDVEAVKAELIECRGKKSGLELERKKLSDRAAKEQ